MSEFLPPPIINTQTETTEGCMSMFYDMRDVKMRDGQSLKVAVVGESPKKYKKYVILVHGIGGNHNTWLPFALPFMMDYTFIIPNLRGFGDSGDVPYNKPTDVVRNFAEDIDDLVHAFVPDGDTFILAGLSMGAYACMCYIDMTKGARVEKYLSVDQSPKAINSLEWPYGFFGERHRYGLSPMINVMRDIELYLEKPDQMPSIVVDEFIKQLGEFFEFAFHRPYEKLAVKLLMWFRLPVVLKAVSADNIFSYYCCLKSYVERNYDFRDVFAKHDVPLYLHIGKHSEMYPAEGQKHLGRTAKALVQAIEFDEAHALMYTAPLKFYGAFSDFLHRT